MKTIEQCENAGELSRELLRLGKFNRKGNLIQCEHNANLIKEISKKQALLNKQAEKDKQSLIVERMKEMINSCFAYGGIGKDSYNFNKYIAPYKVELGMELFNTTYEQKCLELSNYAIKSGVYTDAEGGTYNEIVKVEKSFLTENGFVLTEQEILNHIESEQDKEDAKDILNLSINGEILINTEWVRRVA